MIVDQNEYETVTGSIISFPTVVFGDVPRQPSSIKETVVIGGSTSTGQSIQGSVDD